jgi:hypothetical protein
VVTLTAAASAGSIFIGWSGDCRGRGSCTLTMNVNHEVIAAFARLCRDFRHLNDLQRCIPQP